MDDPCRPGCPLCSGYGWLTPGAWNWSPWLVESWASAALVLDEALFKMLKEVSVGSD